MFKAGDYLYWEQKDGRDLTRYVVRVVKASKNRATIERPLFVCFGSAFKRWGQKATVRQEYLARTFQLMPVKLRQRYERIRDGESTDKLFKK
jgi:hypothetical protein